MREIETSAVFRKDFRRTLKNSRYRDVEPLFEQIVQALAEDRELEIRFRDHALLGHWNGYRECHLKPDLLLIYKKTDNALLYLARLGSHSDLFAK
ncbi:MAG: type II toxin-antitoxin system YafQ family toxin [Acidobacteria bacterium]|nr:type II toxin-antitoxin system YafQ family toxin [Acidobacteriota bacterium]